MVNEHGDLIQFPHHSGTITRSLSTDMAGLRLDQALAQVFPEYSRSRLKEWLLQGCLRVAGKDMRPRDKVNGDETIFLEITLENQGPWSAEAIDLSIVFEDESLLVINKPAGLVVHPAIGHRSGTLINALLHHAPELAHIPRAGLLHRLDKDTSGLLLVAKTLTAQHFLSKQLLKRAIHREYRAIVMGVMTAGGTIEAPIGRHSHIRTKMAVVDSGKPSVTHYRVIERFASHTYIKVMLETGRTHQIRVHMAHIHYPVLGDRTYSGRKQLPPNCSPELKEELIHFKRQALHAHKLAFLHPVTKEPCEFTADVPEDMTHLLELLRKK